MRRIKTIKENDKSKRRNQFIVSGILIVIMLFSIVGYGFIDDSNPNGNEIQTTILNYNNFQFLEQNGFWILSSSPGTFFSYNPTEVESITSVNLKDITNYQGEILYLVLEDPIAEQELRNNLNSYAQKIESVCLEGFPCENNLPLKSCDDKVISLQISEEN